MVIKSRKKGKKHDQGVRASHLKNKHGTQRGERKKKERKTSEHPIDGCHYQNGTALAADA